MSLKKFVDKLVTMLPREMFGNYQTIVIEKGSASERNKHFDGGPGKYQFELICKQENQFAVWFGKASKIKDDRFEGQPTDKKIVAGKGKVKRILLSGKKYRLESGDRWLVKVRAETFANRGDNTLDVYCTQVED